MLLYWRRSSWNIWVHINDLRTLCPIYKYVDDRTIFEICHQNRVSVIQDSVIITLLCYSDNDYITNNYMIVCFSRDRTYYVESLSYIDINGTNIERVIQANVFGVVISSH